MKSFQISKSPVEINCKAGETIEVYQHCGYECLVLTSNMRDRELHAIEFTFKTPDHCTLLVTAGDSNPRIIQCITKDEADERYEASRFKFPEPPTVKIIKSASER